MSLTDPIMPDTTKSNRAYITDLTPSEDGKTATWTAANGKVVTFQIRSPKEMRRLHYELYGYGKQEEPDWEYKPRQSRFVIGRDGRWVERGGTRSHAAIAAESAALRKLNEE